MLRVMFKGSETKERKEILINNVRCVQWAYVLIANRGEIAIHKVEMAMLVHQAEQGATEPTFPVAAAAA